MTARTYRPRPTFPSLMALVVALLAAVPAATGSPPGWTDDLRLSEGNIYDQGNPAIASDILGRLHVFWDDTRNADLEIYYRQWTGDLWIPEYPLTGG
jgi:hypothetical protein